MDAAASSKLFDMTLINDDVETTYTELTSLIARLRPDILGKEVDEQEREKGGERQEGSGESAIDTCCPALTAAGSSLPIRPYLKHPPVLRLADPYWGLADCVKMCMIDQKGRGCGKPCTQHHPSMRTPVTALLSNMMLSLCCGMRCPAAAELQKQPILVVAGPSRGGREALLAQLVATYPDTFAVPAYVTDRKPAKGEVGEGRVSQGQCHTCHMCAPCKDL
jgi:hypothetical protein